MQEEYDDVEQALAKIIGEELRHIRDDQGITRKEAVRLFPFRIGDRTLLSYEEAMRNFGLTRFMAMCYAYNVDPAVVVHIINARFRDPTMFGFVVDLRKVLADDAPEYAQLRQWARNKGGRDFTELTAENVRELAAMMDMPHHELAGYLLMKAAKRVVH